MSASPPGTIRAGISRGATRYSRIFGDSVTTDHISSTSSIPADSARNGIIPAEGTAR